MKPAYGELQPRAAESENFGIIHDMEKYFNTAGPCVPAKHYMLPALDRLPGIRRLVGMERYFVIHAPRQTGKTTALKALVREINAKGAMVALYCTLETLQNARDPARASMAIAALLRSNAVNALPDIFSEKSDSFCVRESSSMYAAESLAVRETLTALCRRAARPLVVFFDEADCLAGDVLISFLRQLRDGYVNREDIPFPSSIALVGMLDVRDYKAQIRSDGESLGQISPFNIISEDMLLRNFSAEEVSALYAQHTEATGQPFAAGVLDKVMEFSGGQPWLVNALARECVEKTHGFRYGETVTADDIETAKETIIRRRDTHVDSLMERLREPRVRRVVEPVIFGGERTVSSNSEDWRFVVDVGLLREENGTLVPANKMYAEIIGRYLSRDEQECMGQSIPQAPWATEDGLDMPGLMAAFQKFWRENSGADRRAYEYGEATPHLVLMAFLQRVTNGQGRINREMALGSGRLDLCVEYRDKRYAVEVKTAKNFKGEDSYRQLWGYLDTLGLSEGWMPIFDPDPAKSWDEKLYTRDVSLDGKTLHVVGL